MISAILAISKNNCIGKNNSLPWPRLKNDMKWFYSITKNNIVVMGSSTWKSLGKHKPLKDRINVVISKNEIRNFPGVNEVISNNLPDDIKLLNCLYPNREIYIIGGAQIYNLCKPIIDTWYITRVDQEYNGDTFLDLDNLISDTKITQEFSVNDQTPNTPPYHFEIYRK